MIDWCDEHGKTFAGYITDKIDRLWFRDSSEPVGKIKYVLELREERADLFKKIERDIHAKLPVRLDNLDMEYGDIDIGRGVNAVLKNLLGFIDEAITKTLTLKEK
jgi:hypothetical protein